MDEFSHCGGDHDHFVFATGAQALSQGTHDGIAAQSGDGGPVEGFAQLGVAVLGQSRFALQRAGEPMSRRESAEGGGGASADKALGVELSDQPGASGYPHAGNGLEQIALCPEIGMGSICWLMACLISLMARSRKAIDSSIYPRTRS